MYYDARGNRTGDNSWTTNVVLAYSRDGRTHSQTRSLGGLFNLALAPLESEDAGPRPFRFRGDYFGLVGLPHGFAAAFTMARPRALTGPTDIFFARAPSTPQAHRPRARATHRGVPRPTAQVSGTRAHAGARPLAGRARARTAALAAASTACAS